MIDVADGHEGRHRLAGGEEGAGRRPRVPARSTIRSTARCATRAASARCRTRRSPTARARRRFVEEKRHFEKPIPISDLVLLDRERCILCDRCTRFANEVAGDPLIHFIDRGNETEVNTFPDEPFASYFSGNTVQICPVGALHRDAVPVQGPAVGPRAGRVDVHGVRGRLPRRGRSRRRNRVLRYQGVDIDPVNWGWLCDKGRFGFEAVEQRRPPRRRRCVRERRRARRRRLVAEALDRGGRRASREAIDAAGAGVDRRARRRPAHQRGRLRVGQAGQGRDRHRQRRRPARRRPARRARARPAAGHHRRGVRRRRHRRRCSGPTSRRSCRSCTCGCATPSERRA